MLQVYFPTEWIDFQQRLLRNHKDIWTEIQSLDKNDAIHYLNVRLGTTVALDEKLQDAGRIFMNALIRREGAIILLDGSDTKGIKGK